MRFKHSSSTPVTFASARHVGGRRKVGAYRPVVLSGAQAGLGLRGERGGVGKARRVRVGDVEEEVLGEGGEVPAEVGAGFGVRCGRGGGGGEGQEGAEEEGEFHCCWGSEGGRRRGWWWAGYILDGPGAMIHRRTYTPLGGGSRPTRPGPDPGPRVLRGAIFPGPHRGIGLTISRRAHGPRSC